MSATPTLLSLVPTRLHFCSHRYFSAAQDMLKDPEAVQQIAVRGGIDEETFSQEIKQLHLHWGNAALITRTSTQHTTRKEKLIVHHDVIISLKPVPTVFSFKSEIQDFKEEMGERFDEVHGLLAKYEQQFNGFKEEVIAQTSWPRPCFNNVRSGSAVSRKRSQT